MNEHQSITLRENLIAYCGVDCSVCSDYMNHICPGCRATVWTEENMCMAVGCCRKRKIESCGQCESFPCAEMKEFYKESQSHKEAYERLKAVYRSRKERDG